MDFLKKLKHAFIPSGQNVYRPYVLRKPWLIFFVTIILTAEGVYVVDLLARQSAFDFIAAVLPGEVIVLTNIERAQNNIGPLVENVTLAAAAQAKATDMATKGYFSHVGPDGKEPWVWIKDAGYNYQYAGENLAVRFTDSKDVVSAWMASPTHRANVVKPVYTEIGVGVAQGEFRGEPATYVVQYFAVSRSSVDGAAPRSKVGGDTPRSDIPTLPQSNEPSASVVPPIATVAVTNPQVEGASTGQSSAEITSIRPISPVSHTESPWGSVAKGLLQSDTSPSSMVLWILAGVAALMVVGLALTFFVHIQVQPSDMLIGGTVIAVIAISFLMLNSQSSFAPSSTQTAAVLGAMPTQGGFIDSMSAFSGAE